MVWGAPAPGHPGGRGISHYITPVCPAQRGQRLFWRSFAVGQLLRVNGSLWKRKGPCPAVKGRVGSWARRGGAQPGLERLSKNWKRQEIFGNFLDTRGIVAYTESKERETTQRLTFEWTPRSRVPPDMAAVRRPGRRARRLGRFFQDRMDTRGGGP